MSQLPGLSTLAASPLWERDFDKIHPIQLHAFLKRCTMNGQKDAAETAITICIAELVQQVAAGAIPRPILLDYSPPNDVSMTAGELREGLFFLGREKAAAILFALETKMTGYEVGRLTWTQVLTMFQDRKLSELAQRCTRVCPRQLHLTYVFWQMDPELDLPCPLMSIEADVFDAFGLLWLELADAYSRLIMIDTDADAVDFLKRLQS